MNLEKGPLSLENQLCFPLYACAKEIVRAYQPHLDELDLTYTQFIVMMVLWEHKKMNVKTLGSYLYLDSGTLTPLLRKLEKKGYVARKRSRQDERTVIISMTAKGEALYEQASHIPRDVLDYVNITDEEFLQMYKLLYKVLVRLQDYNSER